MIGRRVTGSFAVGAAVVAAALIASAHPASAAMPGDCAGLMQTAIGDGSVTAAAMVVPPPVPAAPAPAAPAAQPGAAPAPAPPPPPPPAGPPKARVAYCRVQVTVKPEPGSNIRIELWLPEPGKWNGKFLGTGNGGAGGSIVTAALIAGVNRGYAVANTDLGSSSGKGGLNFGFGIGHPELQRDFNYRATDAMTQEGKALTAAFYGQKPKYAYFQGCSSGGAQGWEQIQRMPDAYNGVIIGAAANQRPNLHMARIWNEWNNLVSPEATVSRRKMELVASLATAQCDRIDGVRDGIISDPRSCFPDLKPILCKGADDGECLTKRQSDTVRAIWKGATNPRTKARVYWGFESGSEGAIDLHWDAQVGPGGQVIVSDNLINWSEQYQQAHPDGVGFDFDKDVTMVETDLVGAHWVDPTLAAFQRAGGKVIIYHGWADGLVPPGGTVDFYNQIVKANGGQANTVKFARLFMAPGMGHCGGGVGPNQFDMLTEMEFWVEKEVAPDSIMATRLPRDGLPLMTRPLCPYPSIERYIGEGSINDVGSFVCGKSGGDQAWSDH